jgi:cation:H+ antiporter
MQYGAITRYASMVFLALFLLFVGYLYFNAKKEIVEAEQTPEISLEKILLYLILGGAALIFGGDLTVKSAINLAQALHVSNRIIGLTVVAIGTSLPELVTCIVAAYKKHAGLVLGNIIGSNIFNILFVLGISGLVRPINFEYSFFIDSAIAVVSTVFLLLFAIYRQKLTRRMGAFFFACYIGYILYLI